MHQPDIMIVEGLNVLQTGGRLGRHVPMFVSDFDYLIYVDAHESDIEQYIDRFPESARHDLQESLVILPPLREPGREDAIETARGIWQSINLVNLRDNVLPTRERAHLILEKGRITRSAKRACGNCEARNTWFPWFRTPRRAVTRTAS